ncbi:bacteriocin immunity protein [Lactobacillus sp. CC-MHH1034]|uniref:bacteriocin immunity protein n=1 Tax=Agrilactobacillus fermenti TaxID=2586909 RepID=UPI0038B3468A|nr:bacteriocin immunity protein [Agrilactobacillus fermenti]
MPKEPLNTLINKTLLNDDVSRNTELKALLTSAQSQLNEGTADNIVATKLEHSISTYLLKHHLQAPKALLDLSNRLQKKANWYRGIMSSITWFTN